MNEDNLVIRLETENDYRNTENLVRESFWNVYKPGCNEHYVLHTFRKRPEFVPELDFVMEKDGQMIGQIMYVRATIEADDGRTIPIMTFGPIGIAPEFKRQGYGKKLLDYSLEKAKEIGAGAICMEGNIDFYGKSGFVVASTMGIHYHAEPRDENVPYFLCKELTEGYLNGVRGVYHTPKGYYVDESEVEEFDKSFPPKQKLKLPGQIF
jgi:Predicted acetyltransferase